MKIKEHINIIDNHITKYGAIYILTIAIVFATFYCVKRRINSNLLMSQNKSTIGKIIDMSFNGRVDTYTFTYKFNVNNRDYYNTMAISYKDLDNLKCKIGHYYKILYKPDDIKNNQLLIDSFVGLSEVRSFFRNKSNPFNNDSLLIIDSVGKETMAIITDSTYNLIGRYSFAYRYKVDDSIYQIVINNCSKKVRFRIGDKFKLKYMDYNKEIHYFYFYEPIK